ncbi:carbamoyltransferase C-terminal domain-containing protein [Paraburkholderia nemoris]|uniref:carbamoyltransferase family protein n=1 Tax=Paraburkholderia nemoris TaxID=2793076 RepID=UPI0038BCA0B8
MLVLGLNGTHRLACEDALPGWEGHDAAAVLMQDGEILVGIEEERLDRIKHSNHFPLKAIQQCLAIAGVNPSAIDAVAVNFDVDAERQSYALSALLQQYVGNFSGAKLHFVNHQQAHLLSAYIPSGYRDSLCLSLDGVGDGLSGAVAYATGRDDVRWLRNFPKEASLGHLYCEFISYLGFQRFEEYKVMALAALGDERRVRKIFDGLYSLGPNGGYELLAPQLRRKRLEQFGIVVPRRRAERPSAAQCDFAAGLQFMLIELVDHIVRHFQRETGASSLAFAGGVAHNCALASHLIETGIFRRVFVQPAAHDAGGALGAAIYASIKLASPAKHGVSSARSAREFSAFIGSPVPDKEKLRAELLTWNDQVSIEESLDIFDAAARQIVEGKVIGWVQGRSEFGPRALGNRSILASTRDRRVRDRINEEIKERETFQPFAPAVTEESVWNLFEQPPTQARLGFMSYLLRARREVIGQLAPVVHEDGTARVQVVNRDDHPSFHTLISRVNELSGIPAVLNTSFNRKNEPIVDNVHDAVASFLLSGLDSLFIGQFEVTRTKAALMPSAIGKMYVELPESSKIVWRSVAGRGKSSREFFLETTFSRHLGGGAIPLSRIVGEFLLRAEPRTLCGDLYAAQGERTSEDSLSKELVNLWRRGLVKLRPR